MMQQNNGVAIPVVPEGSGVSSRDVLGSLTLCDGLAAKLAVLMSEGVEIRLGATLERRGLEVRFLSVTICPQSDPIRGRVPNWPTVLDGGLTIQNPRGVKNAEALPGR